MVRLLFAIASISVVTACATAPPKKPDISSGDIPAVTAHLEELISHEMAQNDLTGLSIAVVKGGDTVWSEGFGSADLQTKAPATADTLFRAGSTAKVVNAVKVMQLVEQDRLALDQDIRSYLPGFSVKSRDSDSPVITLRQLLSHQSGLPSDRAEGMWGSSERAHFESTLDHLSESYLSSVPGTVFSYSNLGFNVVGEVIAQTTETEYPDAMDALLSSLGMTQSYFSPSPGEPSAATGYSGGKLRTELSLRDVPAGGLSASARDMARLLELLTNQGNVGGAPIISESSLAEILQDQTSAQPLNIGIHGGLGVFQYDGVLHPDLEIYLHDGATHSHRALIMFSPKHQYGVALLSNDQNAGPSLRRIGERGLTLLHEATYGEPPAKRATAWPKHAKEDNTGIDAMAGYYATPIGLARFLNDKGTLKVEFADRVLSTHRHRDQGPIHLSYRLLGIFPVNLGELGRIGFSTREVEGKTLLIGTNTLGHSRVAGVRIHPVPISPAWEDRLGDYELVSEFPVAEVKPGGLALKDGFLVASAQLESGEKLEYVLQPVNDQEAIIAGIGRSLGETVTVRSTDEGELFEYAGLVFKRIP